MRSDRTLRMAWCIGSLSTVLLLGTTPAQAELSVLTIDGQVRSLAPGLESTQKRIALGEGGRPMIVDEYAAVSAGPRGTHLSFATKAFEPTRAKLAMLDMRRSGATTDAQATAETEALLIQHQAGHPPNHNFAPMPTAEFTPQPVSAEALEGQRGFAIVDIGDTGRVVGLKLLAHGRMLMDRNLETAIVDGLKTTFKDERRHDHTVYLAYEIRGQTVSQVGSSLISMPQCVPICD